MAAASSTATGRATHRRGAAPHRPSAAVSMPVTRPASSTLRPSTNTVCTFPPLAQNTRFEMRSCTGSSAGVPRSTSTMSARLPASRLPRSPRPMARAPATVAISRALLRGQRRGRTARGVLQQAGRLHLGEQVVAVVVERAIGAQRHVDAGRQHIGQRQDAGRHLHVGDRAVREMRAGVRRGCASPAASSGSR